MTNSVELIGGRRLLLLGGMLFFFVIALAAPRAFDGDGVWFGVGYLGVIIIHGAAFLKATKAKVAMAFRGIAPLNLAAAGALIAGGVTGGTAQYLLWTGAAILPWLISRFMNDEGFEIEPVHFVERHSLVLIVTLGEAVLVTGQTLASEPVSLASLAVATLSLALAASLWAVYFTGRGAGVEKAFAGIETRKRPRAAIAAFFLAHTPILAGILCIAAAEKHLLAHSWEGAATADALLLGGGVLAFLVGLAGFHERLGMPRSWGLYAALIPVVATIAVGVQVSGVAQLAALAAVVLSVAVAEARSMKTTPAQAA